jgi:LacI family kdg operon repressor
LIGNVTPRVERISGFKKALQKYEIYLPSEYVMSCEVHEIKKGLEKMLALSQPPAAILAGNDLALMEVLNFTKENKIKIPDDLALIGIDDVSFANIFNPPLTTISQPAFEMGKKAAELLIKKINSEGGNSESQIYRFMPRLIERESC